MTAKTTRKTTLEAAYAEFYTATIMLHGRTIDEMAPYRNTTTFVVKFVGDEPGVTYYCLPNETVFMQ
jgi:hypothetical protein